MPVQTQIKLRRGTDVQWDTANPVLSSGELALDTTLGDMKIGDGTTPWKDLPFRSSRNSKEIVNVKDFGAKGDGVTDDYQSIKNALAKVPAGGKLYFPPGHYWAPYKAMSDLANWLTIDKSGISFIANPGSVTLDNFLIFIQGTYGALNNIAANMTIGDDTMPTTAAHGLAVGDHVQMLSAMNAYTTDNGVWSLGSSSPTDSQQPIARYSEIHEVEQVVSTTSAKFSDLVVYPNYNITAPPTPIAGITRSQWRKLNLISDITFFGIKFLKSSGVSSVRGIIARAAKNLTFDQCEFESDSLAGSQFKASDCYNTVFKNCTANRTIDTFSGSSWNTFFIGGGCHGALFDRCTFVGGAQTIDFTPTVFDSTSDPGGSFDAARSNLTVQFMKVTNCTFRNNSDGATSHPGTYMFEFSNNIVDGGSTGVRCRSKSSRVIDNVMFTSRCGASFSAMVHDSLVMGNTFVHRPSAAYVGWYEGISYNPISSEIMNLNDVDNFVIQNNTFKVVIGNFMNAGIGFNHSTNTTYAPYTDNIKNNKSHISILNNVFEGCSIDIEQYVNGTLIDGNKFAGGSDKSHYIYCADNSANNIMHGNYFADVLSDHIRTGNVTLTGHTYGTAHRIGLQYGDVPMLTSIVNADATNVYSDNTTFTDLTVSNGGGVEAVRAVGTAELHLNAKPQDNSSIAFVSVFSGNTTTADKIFRVYGQARAESFRIGIFGAAQLFSGAGSPEGSVVAQVGSMYLNTSGSTTTTLYIKTSGTGNTGWTAK